MKESIVEIWDHKKGNPYDFARDFNLSIKELVNLKEGMCYLFEGLTEDVMNARIAGYFYLLE